MAPHHETAQRSERGADGGGAGGTALPRSLGEYQERAREQLPASAYDYFATGVADELTLRRNRSGFEDLRLRPRVLVDVSRLDLGVELLGQRLEHPILLAPAALHRLAHPDGEVATARGAAAAGAVFVAATLASASIEEIAAAAPARLWFQLYVQKDRGLTRSLVERAEAAGCQALCVTVDVPMAVPGMRSAPPPEIRAANFPPGTDIVSLFDASLEWKIIDWLRSFARVPIVLKGILTPEDAVLAVEHGAEGIIVSNHGGRQLDTLPATIDALPGVVAAVAGRVPVLMDGGVRRGTDILKALALGARAVLVARPYLWGLAVAGEAGVRHVIQLLRSELEVAMAHCGTPRLADIGPRVLW